MVPDPGTVGRRGDAWAEVGRFVRFLAVVLTATGLLALVIAALTGSRAVLGAGFAVGVFEAWMLLAWRRADAAGVPSFVAKAAIAMLALLVAVAVLLPEVGSVLAVAVVIPVAAAYPFLPPARVRVLMLVAVSLCVAITLRAELGGASELPPSVTTLLRLVATACVAATIMNVLWQYRARLSASTRELRGLVTLSRDLSGTLDPTDIGARLARHLAEAARAETCVISSWDRASGEVVTYAAYPPDRLAVFAQRDEPGHFPLTRQVLERRDPLTLHTDGSDSLAMLPLVARGETVGLIELARDGARFDERELDRARALADEAATALQNARLHERVRHQAFHDELTGMPNRAFFTDRLEQALARAARSGATLAVLFIDVDDLKAVNDRLGHARGDQLLVAVAERLRASIRSGDTAARLGGDEFAMLLEDLPDRGGAELIAHRILGAMAAPIDVEGLSTTVGVSIGIAHPEPADTPASILRRADSAMYRAKSDGKAGMAVGPRDRATTHEAASTAH